MASNGDPRRGGGHLPPGHLPGPQSRRVARGQPLGVGLIALFVVGFLGGGIALLATASHAKSPSGSRVGAGIFFAFAIVMIPVLWLLWRRWRDPQARHLQLRVEPVELRRGDTVNATLVITNASKCGEKLEAGLVCTEYYDKEQTTYSQNGQQRQRVTRTAEAFATWKEADRAQAQQSVQFTVPIDAPFSYEGGTVSWAWHVSVRDVHARKVDPHRDLPVWVSP